jgi:hypothetical protein
VADRCASRLRLHPAGRGIDTRAGERSQAGDKTVRATGVSDGVPTSPECGSTRFQLATGIRRLLRTPGFLACGKAMSRAAGGYQRSLWITSGRVVFCLCVTSANHKISQDEKRNDSTAPLGRSRRETPLQGISAEF